MKKGYWVVAYEIALAARESEAYQKALRALGSGAERDFRIVVSRRPNRTFVMNQRMRPPIL
jgi:hypothetical protein